MFDWRMFDTWIVVVGAFSAMACALVGCFLVMRRMSMMGDAISHAVLPGLAAAYMFTGSRESGVMFLGAAAVGVLTALFTQSIHRWGKVEESAAMGVVFTTLFAIGLILIRQAADHVDLDAECVLQGAIEMTPTDMRTFLGLALPRAAWVSGSVLVLNLGLITLFWKEFKISSFDPALATTQGINATFMHYLLMVLVAVTTVACFEAVGSILVIAMLIVPAATACLLSERLSTVIVVSVLLAAASAFLGHLSAITLPRLVGFSDTTTAGMMASVAGAFFLVALLAAPRHGVISKLLTRLNLSLRIVSEDLLGILYRLEEEGKMPHADFPLFAHATGVSTWRIRRALARLRRSRLIVRHQSGFALTDSGREQARQILRSHRLWESYIDRLLNASSHSQHFTAERLEHVTDASTREALAKAIGLAAQDPQGKDIPEN